MQRSSGNLHKWDLAIWRMEKMTGYCVKCRETREIQNAEQVTMKNGRPATRGTCPVCNTGMYRIGRAS